MEIKIENLGKLKSAKLELGDFTIICGENNTGKTYATYALYGFLDNWHIGYAHTRRMLMAGGYRVGRSILSERSVEFLTKKAINQLLEEGNIQIDIRENMKHIEKMIGNFCKMYTEKLPKVFASSEEYFKETAFSVSVDKETIDFAQEFNLDFGAFKNSLFSISKKSNSTFIDISLIAEKGSQKASSSKNKTGAGFIIDRINSLFSRVLFDYIVSPIFPKPFISSAERTGVTTFRNELNFARNKLLSAMSSIKSDDDLIDLYRRNYTDYPLPINANVDFIRGIESILEKESFIAKKHPKILEYFSEIIDGEYVAGENDKLRYSPSGSGIELKMTESSGNVRSLLDIGFYLKHSVEKGDLLMIDEPELNLHPKNQRKMARLFAMLVNAGIKVFITTHSDYIVHELNILILLNSKNKRLQKIAKEEKYEKSTLLSHEKVKLYTAKRDNKIKSVKNSTLEAVVVDPEEGIDIKTFNEVIDEMTRIQERILYGGG